MQGHAPSKEPFTSKWLTRRKTWMRWSLPTTKQFCHSTERGCLVSGETFPVETVKHKCPCTCQSWQLAPFRSTMLKERLRWEHVWEMATRKWRGTGNLKSPGFAGQGKPQLRRQGDFSLYTYQERLPKEGKELIKLKNKS